MTLLRWLAACVLAQQDLEGDESREETARGYLPVLDAILPAIKPTVLQVRAGGGC